MANKLPSYDNVAEEDFIDIDISSTTFLCCSPSSPSQSREFEFQMSRNPPERETTTSHADELFYKGNLLPLHIPPRLQMVEKLLQSSTNSSGQNTDALEEDLAVVTTANATESCKISPSNSCHTRRERIPEEDIYECSAELTRSQIKKSWSRRAKLIRQSSIGLKLKASKAYLKSIFNTKSGQSNEPNAAPKAKAEKKSSLLQLQKESWLMEDKRVTTLMKSIERERLSEEESLYRKSFSGAINCHLTPRSSTAISSCSSPSSSFSSVNSIGFYMPQMLLDRCGSLNSEIESSIQGAIAYCKESQVSARKSVHDTEASTIVAACKNQERAGPCRG